MLEVRSISESGTQLALRTGSSWSKRVVKAHFATTVRRRTDWD
ncbi:MAG: hypothetical protein ACKERG_00855 [Candidatus Hodgkinia cicadicola]